MNLKNHNKIYQTMSSFYLKKLKWLRKGIISSKKLEIQVIITMITFIHSSERIFNQISCTGNAYRNVYHAFLRLQVTPGCITCAAWSLWRLPCTQLTMFIVALFSCFMRTERRSHRIQPVNVHTVYYYSRSKGQSTPPTNHVTPYVEGVRYGLWGIAYCCNP